ncbi:MAG: hypothetical protein JXM69_00590 [Anaerolineae bacterium]|nr:hypothetical protein [Anaerolineae bacterium]
MRNRTCLLLPLIVITLLACSLNLERGKFWTALSLSPLPTPTPVLYTLGPASLDSGLDELNSYRTQITVEVAGQRNGDDVVGHLEAATEVTHRPTALHQILRIDGHLPQTRIPGGISEFYRLDDQVYLKKAGDTLWSQFTAPDPSPGQFGFFELEHLGALPLAVFTPPLTETLNGFDVRHFHFTETDLNHPNFIFNQAQGEVWLADPGDLVVQYIISTTLRVTVPDPTAHLFEQGQLILHYTLTDVNADFTISPPADAVPTTNILSNLPRLPDATIISAFPNLVEYVSATSAISATQFYQQELAAREWNAEDVTLFQEKAHLTYTKEGQRLTLIITPTDDAQKTKIVLNLSPGPQ